jgi:hypothetical protein
MEKLAKAKAAYNAHIQENLEGEAAEAKKNLLLGLVNWHKLKCRRQIKQQQNKIRQSRKLLHDFRSGKIDGCQV